MLTKKHLTLLQLCGVHKMTGFALGMSFTLLCMYLYKKRKDKFRTGDEQVCSKSQFKDAVMSTLAGDDNGNH